MTNISYIPQNILMTHKIYQFFLFVPIVFDDKLSVEVKGAKQVKRAKKKRSPKTSQPHHLVAILKRERAQR
jgi:hypothetical protein